MSALYRSRSRRRSGSNHALPLIAVAIILLALTLVGYFMYGRQVMEYFKGKPPVTIYSNSEANDNLERLLQDLAGPKAQLLELVENERSRLSWVKNPVTRRQFRWIMMERLIDQNEWDMAVTILPEVEQLASIEQLDRLANAALEHKDVELQMRLDSHLQKLAMNAPEKVSYLLRSIRRQAESRRLLNRPDETMNTLALLEIPVIQSRLTDPKDAAEAAALLMMRADESEVKAPVLQKVRNILKGADWPSCSATAELIIEEVTTTMTDNPVLSDATLREIENKLLKSRESMYSGNKNPELLLQSYILLGKARFRLTDYIGASQALAMAEALAEGGGVLNEELKIQLTRMRARSDEQRGAIDEAMIACRYLAEVDTDLDERLKSILFLTKHTNDTDKVEHLLKAWELIEANPKMHGASDENRILIAQSLADLYLASETYLKATEWLTKCINLIKDKHTDLADGVVFDLRIELALAQRKAKNDRTSLNILRDVVKQMEGLSEEDLERMKKNKPSLYKHAVRELARGYLFFGETYTARQEAKKIGEGVPDKVR